MYRKITFRTWGGKCVAPTDIPRDWSPQRPASATAPNPVDAEQSNSRRVSDTGRKRLQWAIGGYLADKNEFFKQKDRMADVRPKVDIAANVLLGHTVHTG